MEKLNKTQKIAMQHLYIWLRDCSEKKINEWSLKNALEVFKHLLANDSKLWRYVPSELDEDIENLQKILGPLGTIDKPFADFILQIVNAYFAVENFEYFAQLAENMDDYSKDKCYYNACKSEFFIYSYINGLSDNFDISTITKFNDELYQVGKVIGSFYNTSVEDTNKRTAISGMIQSKINNLFTRFNFNYGLPCCCKTH